VVPSAAIVVGPKGLTPTLFAWIGTVVWSSVLLPLPPVFASVAVTLQKPIVFDAV
jgi:hypothetical protein